MNGPEQLVALPTRRLLAVGWIAALLVAALWLGLGLVLQWTTVQRWTGPAVAGVTAVATTVQILLLRPWVARSLIRWPMLWIGGSFLRLVLTLAGTLLLYSATPYRGVSLWLAMAAAYVTVMIGETHAYASSMKQLAPAGPPGAAGSGGSVRRSETSDSSGDRQSL